MDLEGAHTSVINADTLIIVDGDWDMPSVSTIPTAANAVHHPKMRLERPGLFIPRYKEITEADDTAPWHQPDELISASKRHISGADYDADSDDDAFVHAWNDGELLDTHSVTAWLESRILHDDSDDHRAASSSKKDGLTRRGRRAESRSSGVRKHGKHKAPPSHPITMELLEHYFELFEDEAYIHSVLADNAAAERRMRVQQNAMASRLQGLCKTYREVQTAQLSFKTAETERKTPSLLQLSASLSESVVAKMDPDDTPSAELSYDDAAHVFTSDDHAVGPQLFHYWQMKRALEGGPLLRCYQTVSDLKPSVALRVVGNDQVTALPRDRRSSAAEDEDDEEDVSEERRQALLLKRLSQVRSRARDIESNARAMVRMRRLRQQLERLRLLVDLTRKREKVKREKVQCIRSLSYILSGEAGSTPIKQVSKHAKARSKPIAPSPAPPQQVFGDPQAYSLCFDAADPVRTHTPVNNLREMFASIAPAMQRKEASHSIGVASLPGAEDGARAEKLCKIQ